MNINRNFKVVNQGLTSTNENRLTMSSDDVDIGILGVNLHLKVYCKILSEITVG